MMIHLPFPSWTRFSSLLFPRLGISSHCPPPHRTSTSVFSSICPLTRHLLLSPGYCLALDSASESLQSGGKDETYAHTDP